ncbi:MAG: hypothetical protein P1U69_13870 [Parvibaculaceae bacterium]|nr:hypothetical protein [Parvibaculaceae bacterium]
MNESYAELATLRHVRVDGNAALDYLAEHVDTFVYELQLKKKNLKDLSTAYNSLNQVRLYFQRDYRDKSLDMFRRELNITIFEAKDNSEARTGARIKALFDSAVVYCIESDRLYETSKADAARWLQVSREARRSAKRYYDQTHEISPTETNIQNA